MKKISWIAIIVLIIILAGAGAWVGLVKFEWEKPTLQIMPDARTISQKLSLKVEDQKSGVREIRV